MQRRSTVFAAALLPLAGLGCASGRAKPPKAPVEIKSMGLLPVKEWEPTGSTAPFTFSLLQQASIGPAPPPITPSLLGMAIGTAIKSAQAAARRDLALELIGVEFSARECLSEHITRLLKQSTVPWVAVESLSVAESIWNDTYTTLPQAFDALLDIQIHGAGYYPEKNIGFVPYVSVGARILNTKQPRDVIDEFGYEIAHGDAKGDRRFYPSPPSLTVAALGNFRPQAPALRTHLNELFRRLAVQLVQDVENVVAKRPRLD